MTVLDNPRLVPSEMLIPCALGFVLVYWLAQGSPENGDLYLGEVQTFLLLILVAGIIERMFPIKYKRPHHKRNTLR